MSRILIIEDNEDLAYGLCSNLEIEGYKVRTASTGRDGLREAADFKPDLILLDLMMPEMDGFEVLESLRKDDDSTPVLILTARGEEMDKVRGLRSGADDYVTKPFGLMELLARVEALLRRGDKQSAVSTSGSTVACVGDVDINPDSRTVKKNGQPIELAPKEFDLLLELIRNNGAVVSRMDLMKKVWGHSSVIISRTVDTHVAELRRKLEDDPANPKLILTARKAGYRIATET